MGAVRVGIASDLPEFVRSVQQVEGDLSSYLSFMVNKMIRNIVAN